MHLLGTGYRVAGSRSLHNVSAVWFFFARLMLLDVEGWVRVTVLKASSLQSMCNSAVFLSSIRNHYVD